MTPAHIHFIGRCKQRFGVALSERQVKEIEQSCRDGGFHKIEDQRPGVALYRVRMGREMAAVAYDSDRDTVLTILPIAWTGRAFKMERRRAMEAADAVAAEDIDWHG